MHQFSKYWALQQLGESGPKCIKLLSAVTDSNTRSVYTFQVKWDFTPPYVKVMWRWIYNFVLGIWTLVQFA